MVIPLSRASFQDLPSNQIGWYLHSWKSPKYALEHLPPLADEFWEKAVRNPFYRPTKTSTTIRIDSDVLLWLKSQGKGYQTRINAILREAMLKELQGKGD